MYSVLSTNIRRGRL